MTGDEIMGEKGGLKMKTSEISTRVRASEREALTIRRLAVTGLMAALTTLMTAYIFHIPVGETADMSTWATP